VSSGSGDRDATIARRRRLASCGGWPAF
jgi:hypothetical protein